MFQFFCCCVFSNRDDKFEKIQSACLKCILKFTNNTEGLREFLKHNRGQVIVAKCVDPMKANVTIQALQVKLCFDLK